MLQIKQSIHNRLYLKKKGKHKYKVFKTKYWVNKKDIPCLKKQIKILILISDNLYAVSHFVRKVF